MKVRKHPKAMSFLRHISREYQVLTLLGVSNEQISGVLKSYFDLVKELDDEIFENRL